MIGEEGVEDEEEGGGGGGGVGMKEGARERKKIERSRVEKRERDGSESAVVEGVDEEEEGEEEVS